MRISVFHCCRTGIEQELNSLYNGPTYNFIFSLQFTFLTLWLPKKINSRSAVFLNPFYLPISWHIFSITPGYLGCIMCRVRLVRYKQYIYCFGELQQKVDSSCIWPTRLETNFVPVSLLSNFTLLCWRSSSLSLASLFFFVSGHKCRG